MLEFEGSAIANSPLLSHWFDSTSTLKTLSKLREVLTAQNIYYRPRLCCECDSCIYHQSRLQYINQHHPHVPLAPEGSETAPFTAFLAG